MPGFFSPNKVHRILLKPRISHLFQNTGISFEIPSVSSSMCGKPSISNFDFKCRVFRSKSKVSDRNNCFFIWNTRFFVWNTKYFKIMCMEYDCHILLRYLVSQIKNLVFPSKYLVFRSKTLDFDRNTTILDKRLETNWQN